MSYQVDASQLAALAGELAGAGPRIATGTVRSLDRGGEQIRDRAKELIRGQIRGLFLPHYPETITSELVGTGREVDVEIGPESDREQGGMGPGVEFGSANAPPLPHLNPALDQLLPRVVRDLADTVARETL